MSPFWHDLLIPGVPLAEKIARPILVYGFLLLGLRLAGKRELAQLNPFDLVVLLTLSNTVQNAIIGDDTSVFGGIIGATTLLALNAVVVGLAYSHRRFSELIEGAPDRLVERGRLNHERLKAEKITESELEEAARKQGFASLKDVEEAILYPGGTFCFIGKVPSADAVHHHQIMRELHGLRRELVALRGRPA